MASSLMHKFRCKLVSGELLSRTSLNVPYRVQDGQKPALKGVPKHVILVLQTKCEKAVREVGLKIQTERVYDIAWICAGTTSKRRMQSRAWGSRGQDRTSVPPTRGAFCHIFLEGKKIVVAVRATTRVPSVTEERKCDNPSILLIFSNFGFTAYFNSRISLIRPQQSKAGLTDHAAPNPTPTNTELVWIFQRQL